MDASLAPVEFYSYGTASALPIIDSVENNSQGGKQKEKEGREEKEEQEGG